MIHRIGYDYTPRPVEPGKTPATPILGITVLNFLGPLLNVFIAPGKTIRENMEKAGQKIPYKEATAMIDTGASCCIIRPEIATQLNLIQTGYQEIISVQDKQMQPQYYGSIGFPWGPVLDVPLVACQLSASDCLIGRDILQYWYLTYDGKNGSITICD